MKYRAGVCPFCEVGSQVFRRCDDGATVVVMCDECGDVWMDPAKLDKAHLGAIDRETSGIPGTELYLYGGDAGWATLEEIERGGWAGFIVSVLGEDRQS